MCSRVQYVNIYPYHYSNIHRLFWLRITGAQNSIIMWYIVLIQSLVGTFFQFFNIKLQATDSCHMKYEGFLVYVSFYLFIVLSYILLCLNIIWSHYRLNQLFITIASDKPFFPDIHMIPGIHKGFSDWISIQIPYTSLKSTINL